MTKIFLNVYNKSKTKVAVLQNAYDIDETQELNKIYSLSFSMPSTDPKNEYCQPFYFVRYGDLGQLYRIIEVKNSENDVGTITYQCEHVITTLVDKILKNDDGSFYLTLGGSKMKTRAVIDKLLSYSDDWELDRCDFTYEYEYGWEQENLLNALYSIPEVFTDKYRWSFDTSTTKWKISLIKIDESINPEYYIRAKMNLLSSESSQVNTDICTRLYPLGYGEGVNQLTIKEVNNGKTYLDAPKDVQDKYGIIEKIVVDRSYESAESLKAYGEKMLKELQSPTYTRTFDVVDLYPITNEEIQNAEVGKICRMTMDMSTAYITKTVRKLDVPGDLQIELSNKTENVADALASLADRVRIESTYSQGATQIYQHSKDANATDKKGSILSLYFPSEMRQINKVLLNVKLDRFRSYSKTTEETETITKTSYDGGNTVNTGMNVGGTSISLSGVSVDFSSVTMTIDSTSDANWTANNDPRNMGVRTFTMKYNDESYTDPNTGDYPTMTLDGMDHTHLFNSGDHVSYATPAKMDDGRHTHYLNSGEDPSISMLYPYNWTPVITDSTGHNHGISLADFSHDHSGTLTGEATGTITVNSEERDADNNKLSNFAHTHTIDLPKHHHEYTIPGHSHDIVPGIFESNVDPSGFSIKVNGEVKTTLNNTTSWSGDITQWLLKKGEIPRNTWIDVEIIPNIMAYVISSVFVQGFVQSRGGGNY